MSEKLPHGWEAWQAAKTYDEKRGWHWQIIGEAPGFSGPVVIGLLFDPDMGNFNDANIARFEWYTPATLADSPELTALEKIRDILAGGYGRGDGGSDEGRALSNIAQAYGIAEGAIVAVKEKQMGK